MAKGDYDYVKISNRYCFDAATTGKMAKELLDYKIVTNLLLQQSNLIQAYSNQIIYCGLELSNVQAEFKSYRKDTLKNRIRAGFRVAGISSGLSVSGMLILLLRLIL